MDEIAVNGHKSAMETRNKTSHSERRNYLNFKRPREQFNHTTNGYFEDIKKIRSSKLSVVSQKVPISLDEMYMADHKIQANYTKPKFGLKSYHVASNMQKEPYYQIAKIVFAKEEDKNKKRDHFLDQVVKLAAWKPCAKMPHDDWSKKSFT